VTLIKCYWQMKSRRMRWVRHVARLRSDICKIVIWKPEGGNNLVDRYRLQANVKIDFREI